MEGSLRRKLRRRDAAAEFSARATGCVWDMSRHHLGLKSRKILSSMHLKPMIIVTMRRSQCILVHRSAPMSCLVAPTPRPADRSGDYNPPESPLSSSPYYPETPSSNHPPTQAWPTITSSNAVLSSPSHAHRPIQPANPCTPSGRGRRVYWPAIVYPRVRGSYVARVV